MLGLPIAYRTPIYGVMGKPMHVPKVANPDSKLVDQVHAEFVSKLIELFDKHKAAYGWSEKKLIIK